jgi:ParB family chromosome partitioning protein
LDAELPIGKIYPDPTQPRKQFNQIKLEELAKSILENGLIQPITVRPANADGNHMIITGERRWRAHVFACIPTVKCYIDYSERNSAETLAVQLVENLDRDDMNPMDTARGFQRLLDAGWHTDQVASRMGLTTDTVDRKLKLLKLNQRIQSQVESGQLTESVGVCLSKLSSEGQFLALRKIKGKSYSDAAPVIEAILMQEQQVDLFAAPESKRDLNKKVRAYNMAMLGIIGFLKSITSDDYHVFANALDDGKLGKRIDEIDLAIKGLRRVQGELKTYHAGKKLRRVA